MKSTNEDSSLPMQDKQETTYRSLKCKETELELSRNETANNLKGGMEKVMPKKKRKGLLKS